MNSSSSGIRLLRATEWKQEGPSSYARVVLAYTGPGHTPLATWDELYHDNGKTRAFESGHYFLSKEVDAAHEDFQKRRNKQRMKEQIPPDPSGPASPIGAGALETVVAAIDGVVEKRRFRGHRELAREARLRTEEVDLEEERRWSELRRFHDELAGDLTDEFSEED